MVEPLGPTAKDDPVAAFASDQVVSDRAGRLPAVDLLTAINAWCAQRGLAPVNRTRLGREMSRRGCRKRRAGANGNIVYIGIRLREAGLREALDRQAATNEILQLISKSPSNTQPVFDAIVRSGSRLFPGSGISVALPVGDEVNAVAVADEDPARIAVMSCFTQDILPINKGNPVEVHY